MKPIGAAVLALMITAPAAAQILTTPVPRIRIPVTCGDDVCEAPVSRLSRYMAKGDMEGLQAYADELLVTLSNKGPAGLKTALGDVRRNYYRLIWVQRDEGAAPAPQSLIVHLHDRAPVTALPGISQTSNTRLIEVFFTEDPAVQLQSVYTSTPLKDPMAGQIPAFVKETGVMTFIAGLPLARGAAGVAPTTYAVAEAVLPSKRSDIRIKDTVITPGSVGSLRRAAADLARSLSTREARLSDCGQKLAAADAAAVNSALDSSACMVPEGNPNGMTAAEVAVCRSAMADLLAKAYANAVQCRDTPPAPGGDPVLAVDKAFGDLIDKMRETRKTGDWKLTNVPRTRYAFGVLTSAIVGTPHLARGTVRAKVGSSGAIVLDPMPTLMSMAVINIHPIPYDAQSDRVACAERLRVFAGTAVTPDFGFGGGVGLMLVRGLSVNAGWADLLVKTPRSGFAVGQTPASGSTPLGVGNAGVWFAGLGYSFK